MVSYERHIIEDALDRIRQSDGVVPVPLPGGGHTYRELEDLKGDVQPEVLLEFLANQGLVERVFIGTSLACPNCSHRGVSSSLVNTPSCEKCSSRRLTRERLIEHKLGGHIHPESSFRQGKELVCPTCNRKLKGKEEYSVKGMWFTCSECNTRYEKLPLKLTCLECGSEFRPEDAEITPTYKYVATEKASGYSVITKESIVDQIGFGLEKLGKVEKNFEVPGKSGVAHSFDLMLKREENIFLIDVAFSQKEVDEVPIMKTFTKSMDSPNKNIRLIIWPKLAKSASSLAKFYKIKHVEISSEKDIEKKLTESLELEEIVKSKTR